MNIKIIVIYSTMEEKQLSEDRSKKRIRQPVSVPFLWEEKPGTPKKDWKPTFLPVVPRRPPPPPPPPVKLIASVPFEWEEKPGKPLPFFSHQQQPPPEEPLLPLAKITSFRSYELYSQEIDKLWEDGSQSGDGDEGDDEMFESEGFETDDSFSSAPSLLANRLASTMMIAGAVPVLETPSSPASETGSSTSSYATGTTSLVGAPFLECLFPLLPPNSNFLGKGLSQTQPQVPSKDFDRESNCSVAIRKPLTLGELIMMSRRRSYRRKAVQENKLSMEFMKSAFGCYNFGTSNGIRALKENWKKQLRLKLI